MLWAPKVRVLMLANSRLSRRPMSDEHDYREQYNEAIARAVAGQVGAYTAFDRHRQALLTFCQRQGISVGRMDTIKTLKSPKPLYQLMAVGHDAQTIAKWQGG